MESSKEEQINNRVAVYPKGCPICGRKSVDASSIAESADINDAGLWYECSCGIIFQSVIPEPVIKDKQFIENHIKVKEYDAIGKHPAFVYAPMIEELTFGRKMLEVGYGTGSIIKYMKKRGWITFGIETNSDAEENDRLFKDSFETTDRLYQKTYDLVWMSFVLEQFKDPLGALHKAKQILQENGVLYIATPDIDFLHSDPKVMWPHWRRKEHYIMWSQRALCRELEKLGFNIIYAWRNPHTRWGYYHSLHIIAQRVYY